ncbi:hypothetical protein SEENP078_16945, partial [Salmonella enterica subsp. enterica serovar Newport str. RI_10P078]
MTFALLHGKRFVQFAITKPIDFFHFYLHRDTFFHGFHVANHTDGLPAGIQRVERIQRGVQRFAIKRAEAFVQELKNQCAFLWLTKSDNA